jgi:hypothetical protein
MNTPPSPGPHLTDQQRHWVNSARPQMFCILRLESLYLFAKILLDTVARALEKYFGQVNSCSLDSHHKLIDNFSDYVEQKKLSIPLSFMETAKRLRQIISGFRDHVIAHDKRLNRITATAVTKDGRATMIATSTIVPPEQFRPQADSIHVRELMSAVEAYIITVIEIVKTNRGKRKLTFAD